MALGIAIAHRSFCSAPWQIVCLNEVLYMSLRHNSSSSSSGFSLLKGEPCAAIADSAAETAQPAAQHTAGLVQTLDLPDLGIFSAGAAAFDALHATTGLPWWAVIPATSIAIKTALLPVSLKQAKIVRTNMVLWTESFEFVRQRTMRAKHNAATGAGVDHARQLHVQQPHTAQQQQQDVRQAQSAEQHQQQFLDAAGSTTSVLQQLQQWHARLQVYEELRQECGVPHPAWCLVNQLLQIPIFIYTAASIRYMARAGWPGFTSEGALWFQDLTQQAMTMAPAGIELPMGIEGLVLPLAVTGIMLTSIRLGFKASGTAAKHPSIAGTWLAPFLSYLPPVLYALTLASTYIKVQLPQAALLHWLATSSYTLTLQLGLKHPTVRRLLGYSTAVPGGGTGDVDPAVVTQAAAIDNADVLVVMGAKHAALQRYNEALYCLHRAMQLDPQNARAHYSAGQIHALQHQWQQSGEHYGRCAELTADERSRGQALYCVGVAAHQQGKYQDALDAYGQALGVDSIKPMVVLGQSRALKAMGQSAQAAELAEAFLASGRASSCPRVVVDALAAIKGDAQQPVSKGTHEDRELRL